MSSPSLSETHSAMRQRRPPARAARAQSCADAATSAPAAQAPRDAPALGSPCVARSRSRGAVRQARTMRLSRATLATIDAAAMEQQSASPWMMGRQGRPSHSRRSASTSKWSADCGSSRMARDMAATVAPTMPRASISEGLALPTPTPAAKRRTCGARRSRALAVSCLESRRPGSRRVLKEGGKTTAAAIYGAGKRTAANLVNARDAQVALLPEEALSRPIRPRGHALGARGGLLQPHDVVHLLLVAELVGDH